MHSICTNMTVKQSTENKFWIPNPIGLNLPCLMFTNIPTRMYHYVNHDGHGPRGMEHLYSLRWWPLETIANSSQNHDESLLISQTQMTLIIMVLVLVLLVSFVLIDIICCFGFQTGLAYCVSHKCCGSLIRGDDRSGDSGKGIRSHPIRGDEVNSSSDEDIDPAQEKHSAV